MSIVLLLNQYYKKKKYNYLSITIINLISNPNLRKIDFEKLPCLI